MVLHFPIEADFRVEELCGRRLFLTHGHHFNVDQRPSRTAGRGGVCGLRPLPRAHEASGGRGVVLEPRLCFYPQGEQLARLYADDGGRVQWLDLDGNLKDELR